MSRDKAKSRSWTTYKGETTWVCPISHLKVLVQEQQHASCCTCHDAFRKSN